VTQAAITTARKAAIDKIIGLGSGGERFLRRTLPLPPTWKRSTVCRMRTKTSEMCDCTMLGALYRAADLENWSFTDKAVTESPKDLYERLLRVKDRSAQVINSRGGGHETCDPWAGVLATGDNCRNNDIVCQLSAEKKAYFQAQRSKSGT
jgi:hypothetical protein